MNNAMLNKAVNVLTIAEISNVYEILIQYVAEKGKGREAMNIVRDEIKFCLDNMTKTSRLISYAGIIVAMAARTNDDLSIMDERILHLTINAIKTAEDQSGPALRVA